MSVTQTETQADAQSDAQKLAIALEQNRQLRTELAAAHEALSNALKPKSGASKIRNGLKKFGASILAALTTPEAVKAEKSLAVIALVRALVLIPSLATVIDIILAALGGPSVGVK